MQNHSRIGQSGWVACSLGKATRHFSSLDYIERLAPSDY
jgi:hypothetical protein